MAKRIYLDLSDEKSGVTGTCQLFDVFFPKEIYGAEGYTNNIAFMFDCGAFQGVDNEDELNSSFRFDITKPEFAIISHGHLDHYLKLLTAIKKGFYGPIFTSYVTKTFLSQVFLEDCLKIEKRRAKKLDIEPNFDDLEVSKMEKFMIPSAYHKRIQYNDNICFYFFDNGHVPGAAVTLIQFTCPGYEDINIVVTGDYNDHNTFFKVNPLPQWVYDLPNVTLIIEATYGDTKVKDLGSACFIKNIVKSLSQGKVCVVPSFSFVRTQEVNYALKEAQDIGRLNPNIPIYNDGKTAIGCTKLFLDGAFKMYPHMRDFLPQNLTFVEDKELRKFLKKDPTPKIIVASSGMGSYGPSQSYINAYSKRTNGVIHATGYLSPTSKLGQLRDSEDCIATFYDTTEFSAHAKQEALLQFVKNFKPENLKSVLVTHGEQSAKETFANVVRDNITDNVYILSSDSRFRITSDGVVAIYPRNTCTE